MKTSTERKFLESCLKSLRIEDIEATTKYEIQFLSEYSDEWLNLIGLCDDMESRKLKSSIKHFCDKGDGDVALLILNKCVNDRRIGWNFVDSHMYLSIAKIFAKQGNHEKVKYIIDSEIRGEQMKTFIRGAIDQMNF